MSFLLLISFGAENPSHSNLFQFRLNKIYLYIFDQASELTAQRLDVLAEGRYRRLWFLSFSTIRFVGWKIGSTTLLAKSCSCILSFWRGFNSLIRTIRIKLSSSSFQKSGLSSILSSKVVVSDAWLFEHPKTIWPRFRAKEKLQPRLGSVLQNAMHFLRLRLVSFSMQIRL